MRKSTLLRAAAVTAGALALTGVAGLAFADEYGTEGVEVSFKIEPQSVWGDLSMTVADNEAALHEDGSDATNYRFSGTLPTVTVTDERDPDTVPSGTGWYVLGQISDFTGDDAGNTVIPASQLGWKPELIDGGELGLVTEGDPVLTSLDANTAIDPVTGLLDEDNPNNVGLVDQELLSLAIDSSLIRDESEWTATAELILKTAKTTPAATYTADLTLTLME
ncbi:MAG: hypothetical protein LBG60_00120 [Bifidobacteriaceae bacterium]|jgi:hypothetical protein|nr:hypothetical protein [Bifidobacteriaceae bacterium]